MADSPVFTLESSITQTTDNVLGKCFGGQCGFVTLGAPLCPKAPVLALLSHVLHITLLTSILCICRLSNF